MVEAWRDQVLAEEETAQHKLGRKIADEEHWLRYGVTARRKRNVRRLGNLHALRQERRDQRKSVGTVKMSVSEGDLSGKLVVEADMVSKTYDKPVVSEFSTRIIRGDRVGIVGANGAGKTTLIRMLIGELPPDTGRIRMGSNVELATLDQRQAARPMPAADIGAAAQAAHRAIDHIDALGIEVGGDRAAPAPLARRTQALHQTRQKHGL